MSDLPKWLQRVIEETGNAYTKGKSDFSTTELISPPLIRKLMKEHKDELEVLPEDQLASFFGTGCHNQIENIFDLIDEDQKEYIVEERMYAEINDYVIGGQIDLYVVEDEELWDHKFTSIYKLMSGDHFDYEAQLNINRWLLHQNGYNVKRLFISGFPLDWRKSDSRNREDYPNSRFKPLEFPLWKLGDTEEFIRERIALHTSESPPVCTEKERWKKTDTWAVMKFKQKRAVKLCNSMREAEQYAGADNYIEFREGKNLRCEEYCPVNKWCAFYRGLHA